MTSSFFTLVISLISLFTENNEMTNYYIIVLKEVALGNIKLTSPYFMVICGLSPFSGLRSMRISRMVWDQ